jgi:hypothetical protein
MLSKWSANAEQMGLYKIRKDKIISFRYYLNSKTSIINIRASKLLKNINLYKYTRKLLKCLRTHLDSV